MTGGDTKRFKEVGDRSGEASTHSTSPSLRVLIAAGMDNRTLLGAAMMLVLAGVPIWLMWRHERNRTKSLGATATSLGATLKPKVTAAEMVALLARSLLGSHGHV
jgi:hypothetical protein